MVPFVARDPERIAAAGQGGPASRAPLSLANMRVTLPGRRLSRQGGLAVQPSGAFKRRVRSESRDFGETQALDLGNALKPFYGEYLARARDTRRLDDTYIFDLADRIAATAKAHPNVIRVDGLRKATASIARKGRADVHVVAVEPTDTGTYVLSRIHFAIDRVSMSSSWDDGRYGFVRHVAERMLERGEIPRDGMRRTGQSLYHSAGLLALGARLWINLKPRDGVWNSVALPTPDGGLVLGQIMPTKATYLLPACLKVTRDGIRPMPPALPHLSTVPRFVHAPLDERLALSFTAMTYIGPGDMTPRKTRVRDLLASIRDRHPVVALAGMSWLWPTSRVVSEAMAARRNELGAAYDEIEALHDDPDVKAMLGPRTWTRTPPLPWEETPSDVRPSVNFQVSRWATPEDVARAREAVHAEWRERFIAQAEAKAAAEAEASPAVLPVAMR